MFSLETVGIKRYPQADMVKVTCMGAFLGALMVLGGAVILAAVLANLAWSAWRRPQAASKLWPNRRPTETKRAPCGR
jgi:hypothetical protein